MNETAFAADTQLGNSCDLAVVGAVDKNSFLLFDRELRAALSQRNVAALALVVSFPLRVNYAGEGTILIANVAALQARSAELFSPRTASLILDQKPADLFCKYTGVMYGSGELWVQPVDEQVSLYRITAMNLPANNGLAIRPRGARLEFVCTTDRRRVVVDTDLSGQLRYRAWNRPRAVTEKPDIEITPGVKSLEGTDPCTHAVWTFKKGKAEYNISELGCTDGSPPSRATGSFAIAADSKYEEQSWCR